MHHNETISPRATRGLTRSRVLCRASATCREAGDKKADRMRDAARRAVAVLVPWPQSHWSVSRSHLRTSSPAAYAQPLVPAQGPADRSSGRLEVQHFTCFICMDFIVSPRTIACGHSFCAHCISHWAEVRDDASCPRGLGEIQQIGGPSSGCSRWSNVATLLFTRGRKLVQPIVPRASRTVCRRGFSSSGSSVCRICVEVWVS
jgi:hypothetical protein